VRRIRSFAAGFGVRVQLHETAQTFQEQRAIILTDSTELIADSWLKQFSPHKIMLCGIDLPPAQLPTQIAALSFYSSASLTRIFESHLPRATILRQLTRCESAEFYLAWGAMQRTFSKPAEVQQMLKNTLRAERPICDAVSHFVNNWPAQSYSLASDGVTLMVTMQVDAAIDVANLMAAQMPLGQVLVQNSPAQRSKHWRMTLALPLVLPTHGEREEAVAPIYIGSKEDEEARVVRLDQTG
jgi:hypothetical protein